MQWTTEPERFTTTTLPANRLLVFRNQPLVPGHCTDDTPRRAPKVNPRRPVSQKPANSMSDHPGIANRRLRHRSEWSERICLLLQPWMQTRKKRLRGGRTNCSDRGRWAVAIQTSRAWLVRTRINSVRTRRLDSLWAGRSKNHSEFQIQSYTSALSTWLRPKSVSNPATLCSSQELIFQGRWIVCERIN